MMKTNRFREKLSSGVTPIGHMIMEFGVRAIAPIANNADLDFVLIDNEHSAFSTSEVADLIGWFQATPVAPFVRVPQIAYHLIARTLDLGALGIMVPNVKTGAEARAIIAAAKYAPMGGRGVVMGNANTAFETLEPAQFLADANTNTTVICQIESVQGLENVEEIAATPGVDVLWVGHFDLTQSQGIPGQFHHPDFLSALERVVAVANKHNLAAGIQPRDPEQAHGWMQMGFNVISYGGDYAVYGSALEAGVKEIRRLAQNRQA